MDNEVSEHYDKLVLDVSKLETLKLDPYFICEFYKVGGGPLEHIVKKGLRGCSKGHSLIEVYAEIIKSAQRGIELEYERIKSDESDESDELIEKSAKDSAKKRIVASRSRFKKQTKAKAWA